MSDDNKSTVQSYVDSATGLGQRAVNSVTGSSSQDNESQNSGTWDQTLGSAKESLGNVTGSENLRRQGIEQNNAGKDAEARGHLEALGNSATDRAQGAIGSVGAAVKGDREEEDKWRKVHDEGKGRQQGVEDTIDKRF